MPHGNDHDSEQAFSITDLPKKCSTLTQHAKGVQVDVNKAPRRLREPESPKAYVCDDGFPSRLCDNDGQHDQLHREPAAGSRDPARSLFKSTSAETSMKQCADQNLEPQIIVPKLPDMNI